jgi:hypothetical protein
MIRDEHGHRFRKRFSPELKNPGSDRIRITKAEPKYSMDNVGRDVCQDANLSGMQDNGWPPPIGPHFHPHCTE